MERRRSCARRYYKLDSAIQHCSRTRPYAFVIAHECKEPFIDETGAQQFRTREYFAFDDVGQYLAARLAFPHAHEVIYPRGGAQEGRLIFDFDVEERHYRGVGAKSGDFVAPSFQQDVERCVKDTFRRYYTGVDLSRLRFVWLQTPHAHKYSRHLIVNGALFSTDWVLQSQTFYPLFKLVAHRSGLFSYMPIDRLVDTQVSRANATFRMAWCSKLDGPAMQPVRPRWDDGTPVTVYDTLVQVHRPDEARAEQRITDGALAIDRVLALVSGLADAGGDPTERLIVRSVPQLKRSLEEMERKENAASLELTQECVECLEALGGCYEVRSVCEGRITLDRTEPGECPISGREHEREGGYVTVAPSGDAYFHCFRKCVDASGRSAMLVRRGSGAPSGGSALGDADEARAKLLAMPKLGPLGAAASVKATRTESARPCKSRQKLAGEVRHRACLSTMMVGHRLPPPEGIAI